MISVETKIHVVPFQFDLRSQSVSVLTVEIDFMSKKKYYFISGFNFIF